MIKQSIFLVWLFLLLGTSAVSDKSRNISTFLTRNYVEVYTTQQYADLLISSKMTIAYIIDRFERNLDSLDWVIRVVQNLESQANNPKQTIKIKGYVDSLLLFSIEEAESIKLLLTTAIVDNPYGLLDQSLDQQLDPFYWTAPVEQFNRIVDRLNALSRSFSKLTEANQTSPNTCPEFPY